MISFHIEDYTFNKLKNKDLSNLSGRIAVLGDEMDDDITVELIKYSNDFPSGVYYSILKRKQRDGLWESICIEDFEYSHLRNLFGVMYSIMNKYKG